MALKTNKCWIHLAKEDNLRIKPSTIPNSGFKLFSCKKPFIHYHKLGRYTERVTTSWKFEKPYKGFTPPNSICKGINANNICINVNQSSDGPLRYPNDIRSRSKTDIGIKDMGKKFKNKFIPIGHTLKHIRPNTELFHFYRKHYN